MLSQITHLLTLLAFATHVVLGCCAHHGHGPSENCCQSETSLQDAGFQGAEQAESEARHNCCGVHKLSLARQSPAKSSSKASHHHAAHRHSGSNSTLCDEQTLADSDKSSPCGRSHTCEGGDCIYMGNSSGLSSLAWDLFVAPCRLSFRWVCEGATSSDFGRPAYHCGHVLGYLSRTQCAMCQSWQI